jgi:hypothetical protein
MAGFTALPIPALGETTLWTRGYQTITATDTADGSIQGSLTVEVRHARHAFPHPGIVANQPATPDTAPPRPQAGERPGKTPKGN